MRSSLLHRFLHNPTLIGSVADSSTQLARAMAATLRLGDQVVEVGAGTGAITRAIVRAGVQPPDLVLVEADEECARTLRARFPAVRVVHAYAEQARVPVAGADYVVSGVPLRNLTREQRQAFLVAVSRWLRPGGVLVQFTYGLRSPIGREALLDAGFVPRIARPVRVWANVPPALVFRYRRAG